MRSKIVILAMAWALFSCAPRHVVRENRCDVIPLTREEWLHLRVGQETQKANIRALQVSLDACERARRAEKSPLPWVLVAVVAVAAVAGVTTVALMK